MSVIIKHDVKSMLKEFIPKKYNVFIINDDVTTMDFVVYVLESIFNKTNAEAVNLMLQVHEEGKGLAGIYVREIAEAKIEQVKNLAKENSFPLQCTMEE